MIENTTNMQTLDEFMQKHPDMPKRKVIDRLDLILSKDVAEKILSGEKTIEFRSRSPLYNARLIQMDIYDWGIKAKNKGEITDEEFFAFALPTVPVNSIHFHNYVNTWYLDIEVNYHDLAILRKSFLTSLHECHNCHELDRPIDEIEKAIETGTIQEKDRPALFFFALGNVLGANLPIN